MGSVEDDMDVRSVSRDSVAAAAVVEAVWVKEGRKEAAAGRKKSPQTDC